MSDFTAHGYEIIEQLGQNIYGGRITYKAVKINDRQLVAIKQFQFLKNSTWEDYKIIQQEIETLQRLENSGIPRYLTHFDSEDGICLVQEYKDAQPLSLQRSFTSEQIKDIARKILEILVYLQNLNPPVIHRDIKPENILIDEKSNIYLVDFGFSKIGEGSVNLSSFAAGTFGFMPPEQLHNLPLTKASDLYGLGATLICLIVGIKSIEIGNLIDLSSNSFQFEHRMSEFSVEFIRWLKQMVKPDPKQRFPNAEEALKALVSISSLVRSPEVKLSQSVLEFIANRLGEKLTQIITIENSIPETILEGHLQVAPHHQDPPHTPDSHDWITITHQHFKKNQVQCKIIVNTSKLKADSLYQRRLLLQTNARQKPYQIDLKVYTAPAPIKIKPLPYGTFLLTLITAFVTLVGLWKLNGSFGNLLAVIIPAVAKDILGLLFLPICGIIGGFLIGGGLGWFLGIVLNSLLGARQFKEYSEIGGGWGIFIGAFLGFFAGISWVVFFNSSNLEFWTLYIKLLVFSTVVIVGGVTTIGTAITTAENCCRNDVTYRDSIILSRLIPALGISLGVGLMLGFSNFWVISAITVTGLPVIKVIVQHSFKSLTQGKLNTAQTSSVINQQASPEKNSKSQSSSVINQQANSRELDAHRNEFLQLLYGDRDACERLIQLERKRNPHKSEIELYQNAISRLLKDRRY
ncbi:serine/threonine protein kinase [Calothrix sp. NIES-2100]|uniref:serine/threonine protein kinase n=1 Tax=Calothrix sp. NIES-2100 TaxID=1954172 RepID=UPI000B616CE4|nr:serine/threonine protein kinase [Calothrix sp. NIES-2100]